MRILSCLLLRSLLLFCFACSHTIPGGLEDATAPVRQQSYQVMGESEGSVSSTFVFGIQTNKPDMEVAIRRAIDRLGGDELINVHWYHKSAFYFLFSKYTFIVRGTVIKRSGEGPAFTGVIRPRPQEFVDSQPPFNGVSVALSYSRGSFNEFGFGSDESISGFSSVRLSLGLKNSDALYYFYPQISYAKLNKKSTITEQIGDRIFQFEFDDYIRTIPVTINVGVNGSKIKSLQNSLPLNVNPYANIGFGYYFTEFFGDWEWEEFGYNLGLGVEYLIQPNLTATIGLNRHSVFTGETYTFWDWSLGIGYYY